MIPAPAEAVRNIKNAAVLMPDIIVIGEGFKGFTDLAAAKGHSVRKFRSPSTALKSTSSSRLLIIERNTNDSLKQLFNASKEIPKVVVTRNGSALKMSTLLRAPLAYPLHSPSDKELLSFTERILHETSKLVRFSELQSSITDIKRELSFFEKMNKILASAQDINEVLEFTMSHVQELTGAEAWGILMLDDETKELSLERAAGKSVKKTLRLKPGNSVIGWVTQKKLPALIPNASKDKRFDPQKDSIIRRKVNSFMCAPLISKGRTTGIIEVVNRSDGNPFSRDDLKMLTRLVSHTAIALERISLQQKLEELVITDDLTSLFNSRYLNRSIETEILRSHRYSSSVAVVFMDLDHFKDVNDNHGHLVGSKVLVEIAQILIDQLRSIDIVARYGGDEFVIVLPQTTLNNAMTIAERIREAIEQFIFLRNEGLNLKLTASFGVAAYPESAHSQEELLRLADESMYKVKHRTRNGVYAII